MPNELLERAKQAINQLDSPSTWEPIDIPESAPGYQDDEVLPINVDPRDCDADDDPDAARCGESEGSGE